MFKIVASSAFCVRKVLLVAMLPCALSMLVVVVAVVVVTHTCMCDDGDINIVDDGVWWEVRVI